MSPKYSRIFNLLRTDQINCHRLAVYLFACTNVHWTVCKANKTSKREKKRKYSTSNCNSKPRHATPTPKAISTFHLHLIIFTLKTCTTSSDTNRTFIVFGKFIDFIAICRLAQKLLIAIAIRSKRSSMKMKNTNFNNNSQTIWYWSS